MRSADALRACLLGALCLGTAGCSSLFGSKPEAKVQPPVAAAAAEPGTKGAAAAPAAAPAPEPEKKEAVAEINPAVQRAFDQARKALAAGRAEEAERAFLALTKSNPELGGPHANLGVIYRQAGKLEQSAAALEQAAKASPLQPTYLNELGITYRQQGQFLKARDAYERAIALDPNYAAPHLNLGILFDMYLWDSARALASYDRYLALLPNGDDKVRKWVADIKLRKPPQSMLSRKEQP